jgi:hypothetical protein
MQVHSLRIKRTFVGPTFPFDRVYLVNHEDRGIVPQLFRNALVMSVDDGLKKMLKEITLDTVQARPFERDDDESAPRSPTKDELSKILKKGTDWLMVVPILAKWLRNSELGINKKETRSKLPVLDEEGQAQPRYIMSKKWYHGRRSRGRQDSSPIPNQSYLLRDGKAIQPICVACPRMVQHQNGECQLGQRICYESLSLGLRNHFKEGLTAPPPSTNVKEIADRVLPEET